MSGADGWTYGAELEWPDVDVTAELPEGWAWSKTDYTVVGSDGIANDPRRELVLRSGELNTPVCRSPEELAERVGEMRTRLQPGHNYRSNLHVHIAGPEFDDLDNLKVIAAFMRKRLPQAIPFFDPLDKLLEGLTDPDEVTGAQRRMAHSERSRHFFISDAAHEVRMEAQSLGEFLRAGVPLSKAAGRPQWQFAPRECVNFRSLMKHDTVEFRCFAGDESADNVHAAAHFARAWTEAALNDEDMFEVPHFFSLPAQAPFNLALERGWAWTNFQHNKRDVVRARLEEMGRL